MFTFGLVNKTFKHGFLLAGTAAVCFYNLTFYIKGLICGIRESVMSQTNKGQRGYIAACETWNLALNVQIYFSLATINMSTF